MPKCINKWISFSIQSGRVLIIFASMKQEQRRNEEVGVIQIYPLNGQNKRNVKSGVPAIFKVRLKRGSQPVLLNYLILKETYPHILFDFFEKKVVLRDLEEVVDPEPFKKKKSEKPQPVPKQIQKEKYKQEEKELKDRMKEKTERTNYSRLTRLTLSQNEFLKEKPKIDRIIERMGMKQSREYALKYEEDSPIVFSPEQENFPQENVPIPRVSKRILDYDNMVEDLGIVNLSSPAVIVTHRQKPQIPVFSYSLPDRQMSMKEIERQPFSSEQFRESEESEFLLDDRGKQKRRREKLLMKEQQRQLRNKGKKIKRRKKMG